MQLNATPIFRYLFQISAITMRYHYALFTLYVTNKKKSRIERYFCTFHLHIVFVFHSIFWLLAFLLYFSKMFCSVLLLIANIVTEHLYRKTEIDLYLYLDFNSKPEVTVTWTRHVLCIDENVK